VASWLVLGVGNALAGADGFGPAVVERLRDEAAISGVAIADAGTDLLDWITRFADYQHVVLVDAVAVDDPADAPAPPPCVAIVKEQTFAGWDSGSPGAHEISPLLTVRLFRALQRANETVDVPSIQLVALFVTEPDFARRPGEAEIDTGATAVYELVGTPPRLRPPGGSRAPLT
jgi:hydrogenase maturation protease